MQLVSFSTCCSINWNNIDHNDCNLDTFKSKELNLLLKAKAQTKNIIKALSLPNNAKVSKKLANKNIMNKKKKRGLLLFTTKMNSKLGVVLSIYHSKKLDLNVKNTLFLNL